MTIATGDRIPSVTLLNQTGDTVSEVNLAARCKGRRVILVGMPGAYTATCSAAHLPSFIRTAEGFRAKGIDEIFVIAVNDVRVMEHWGRTSGAVDAGLVMLADWDSAFTKAAGLAFSNPGVGFRDRLTRCAMVADDGVVTHLQLETEKGVCDLTAGETLLEML